MTNRQLLEDQTHHDLNSSYNTAAHIEHPASCHIASSSQKCCKLWMPPLVTVERLETGEARQWPKVIVPLRTMIRVQATSTASQLSLEAGDYREREQREDGSLGKVEWFGWGHSDNRVGSQWGERSRREGWVWLLSLTATSKDAGARSSLSFDSSYHAQHELQAYIPFLSGERRYNQA